MGFVGTISNILFFARKIVQFSCSLQLYTRIIQLLSVYNSHSMLLIVRTDKFLIRRLQLLFILQYTNNKILYIIKIL